MSFLKLVPMALVLALLPAFALSDPPVAAIAPLNPDDPPPPPEFKTLKISPQGESNPALRYRLDPEIRKQETGNALTSYYRAFSPEWMSYRYRDKDLWKKEEEWANMPLEKLPPEADVRGMQFLKEIDRGTNRSYIDWEMVDKAKKEGIYMLIPDIQGMREFARLLSLRARYELKEKDFAAATDTLRSLITLGRNSAKGPTLIQGLVGIAITSIGFHRVEEAIQQPGFPNLYWALSALPSTPIDLRDGMDGEKLFIDSMFPGLRDMLISKKIKPLGQPELEAMVDGFRKAAEMSSGPKEKSSMEQLFEKSATGVMMAAAFPAAKERLIQYGLDAKQLDALPGLQVVLLGEILVYDETYDSMVKWLNVPFYQSKDAMEKFEKSFAVKYGPSGQVGFAAAPVGFLSRLLLPATSRVHQAKVRIERQLAILKVIEAIRLQAAAKGAWPKTLQEIDLVPVPLDPITGKSFSYKVDGATAMLESQPMSSADRKEFYRYKLEFSPIKGQ